MQHIMKFSRYFSLNAFRGDVLPVLMENEVCNNLPVSIVSDTSARDTRQWLMGTVTDGSRIVLVALCTMPFNMLMYVPDGIAGDTQSEALTLLINELARTKFRLPGIFARKELAAAYAELSKGRGAVSYARSMILMKLEQMPQTLRRAPGFCRVLTEDDMKFVPAWEQAFCSDCRLPVPPAREITERIRTRLDRHIHYIWEDGVPVSQAVYGRETPNGAVINWVYTPPEHRGRGYAVSVVGELSDNLLRNGKKFCCLFADAGNPVSRGLYKKLGYRDVCEFLEIGFV